MLISFIQYRVGLADFMSRYGIPILRESLAHAHRLYSATQLYLEKKKPCKAHCDVVRLCKVLYGMGKWSAGCVILLRTPSGRSETSSYNLQRSPINYKFHRVYNPHLCSILNIPHNSSNCCHLVITYLPKWSSKYLFLWRLLPSLLPQCLHGSLFQLPSMREVLAILSGIPSMLATLYAVSKRYSLLKIRYELQEWLCLLIQMSLC